ncbi:pilin N-terminal domain-containing protein, partial [Streptococcus pneumoniae]|uniref:pilin N-terminal domain-containing protein n=1 Tax=Streptococcus pneumoniae TaxID=1313 RepID=UPI002AB1CAB8
ASSLFSAATVFAAGTTTTSVTVHKLLATDGDMDKIANELETGNYAGNKVGVLPANAKEIAGVMFVWDVALEAGDYALTEVATGFDLKLTDAGLAKVNDQNAEKTVKITYS